MTRFLRAWALWAALPLAACVGLTSDQRTAVSNFTKATSGYSKLPPRVLEAYARLHESVEVLKVSTATAADSAAALQQLHRGVASYERIARRAEALRNSLAILETYSSALSSITGAQDLQTLDADALAFGSALDQAVSAYDGVPGVTPLAPATANQFAGIAATVSGLILSSAQLAFTKGYVRAADGTIQALTAPGGAIEGLLKTIDQDQAIDVEDIDENFKIHFQPEGAAPGSGARPPQEPLAAAELEPFATALQTAADVHRAVLGALRATEAISKLHSDMLEALETGESISNLVAQGGIIAGQIQAGQQITAALNDGGAATPTDGGSP